MLIDIVRFLFGRWILHLGLLFTGVSLMIGGAKYYEHSTYIATPATVIATLLKCEMSYPTGRSRSERVVDCAEVNDIRARHPEFDWSVATVPFVELAYTIENGQPMRATARLSKLERSSVTVGETIPVLRLPDNPANLTGPATAHFLGYLGVGLFVGLACIGLWWRLNTAGSNANSRRLAQLEHSLPEVPDDHAPAPSRRVQFARQPATVGGASGFGRRRA